MMKVVIMVITPMAERAEAARVMAIRIRVWSAVSATSPRGSSIMTAGSGVRAAAPDSGLGGFGGNQTAGVVGA